MKRLAEENPNNACQLTVNAVTNNRYMDDSLLAACSLKKRSRGPEERSRGLHRFGLLPKNNQKTFQLEYDIVLNRIKTGFHAA